MKLKTYLMLMFCTVLMGILFVGVYLTFHTPIKEALMGVICGAWAAGLLAIIIRGQQY